VIVALIAIATAIGLAALASGFGRGEGAAVELPNVVGRSLADATRLLEDLGLESAPTEVDAAAAAGTVIAQDPAAGTDAKPGTPVELTVSNGNLAPPEDDEKEKDEDNDENDDEDERRGDGDGKPGRGKGRGRNSS
jgi:beta-lactam-binding protein with PASTA domain